METLGYSQDVSPRQINALTAALTSPRPKNEALLQGFIPALHLPTDDVLLSVLSS
jgi:hypothetical protein